jgi:hypothetical protein
MKHGTVVDYTARRIGSKTEDGKIVVCPKCGIRGASKRLRWKGAQGVLREFETVTHVKHLTVVVVPFWHVDEHCSVSVATNEVAA